VDDPFEALRRLLAAYRPVPVPGLPRFAGGAVGHIGYDMARAFERLPERAGDDLGLPDACLLLAESLLVFDNVAQKIKVVSHVHVREGESLEAAYDAAVARIDALVARLAAPPIEPAPPDAAPGEVRSNFTQAAYEKIVGRAKEYIRAGDIIQVVVAQRFELPLAAAPFDVYRCLRTVNPSPYMFYLALGDHALAGASPEVMVRVEDGEVTVRPIAGTRPRGTVEREDVALAAELAADPKERAEHVMLLDLGRKRRRARGGDRHGAGDRELRDRALLARHAPGLQRARHAGARTRLLRRLPRHLPGRHVDRRAQDPRHGDHRGARAGAARVCTAARSATSRSRARWTPR